MFSGISHVALTMGLDRICLDRISVGWICSIQYCRRLSGYIYVLRSSSVQAPHLLSPVFSCAVLWV